jgi:hypothetical protein
MDDPVPVRRALFGCLGIAVVGIAVVLLVRPAILTLAPPRGDDVVTLGPVNAVSAGAARREVVLGRSYGWDGEEPLGGGRVLLPVVVAPATFGGVSVVAAASPVSDDCPLEIAADRLVDCEGRAWTFDALPFDAAHPPLDRFEVSIESGTVVVDFTRSLGE